MLTIWSRADPAITIHRGHASRAERLTIAGGWSAEMSDEDLAAAWANPSVIDVRRAWTMDPAVREALPTSWMREEETRRSLQSSRCRLSPRRRSRLTRR